MTREEVAAVISLMYGTAQKVAVLHVGLARPISVHTLRHPFVINLLQRITDIHTGRPRLRHNDVANTYDLHLYPSSGRPGRSGSLERSRCLIFILSYQPNYYWASESKLANSVCFAG